MEDQYYMTMEQTAEQTMELEQKEVNEERMFFRRLGRSKKNVKRNCEIVSYAYLEEHNLTECEKVISKIRSIIESDSHDKVRLEAYQTCVRLGITCQEPHIKTRQEKKEDKFMQMVNIFEHMKLKKWLQPYNAPKFRYTYGLLYPQEYSKIVRNMNKKAKKKAMFEMYRKYYRIFVYDQKLQHWLDKRDNREQKSVQALKQ